MTDFPPLPEPHGKTFDEEGRPVNGGHYYPLEMYAYIAPVLAERDALREQVRVLRDGLAEAIECVEAWGCYASEYFQTKWNLSGDLVRLRAALEATKEKP